MTPFSIPSHRALSQRDLIGGIPPAGILLLFMLGAIFMYGFQMYYMAIPIVIVYIIMRVLSKRDPYMIDIVVENLNQKDIYIP
jgi:type IV secretory pathway TrbD component